MTMSGRVMLRLAVVVVVELMACRAPVPPMPGKGGPPWIELTCYEPALHDLDGCGSRNFYIGTAEGALEEAVQWTQKHAVPWESSNVQRATDDPYILRTVGELASDVRAGALLADRAGDALQAAIDTGEALTAEQRAEAAVAVYEATGCSTIVSPSSPCIAD